MTKNHEAKGFLGNKKLIVTVGLLAVLLVALIIAAILLGQKGNKPDSGETTQPTSQLEQRVDGSYEQWLAAGMMVGVSMEYPDFTLMGIYAAGETEIANKASSQGVYILIQTGGEELLLWGHSLDAERKEPGTTDLYTKELGFNTFDPVSRENVDLTALQELKLEDLGKMIEQSMLLTLYSR